LWWNSGELLHDPKLLLGGPARSGTRLFLAWSSDAEPGIEQWACRLDSSLRGPPRKEIEFRYQSFPGETHATIYQPAALVAFRSVLSVHNPRENDLSKGALNCSS
jgi:hypothetical protein